MQKLEENSKIDFKSFITNFEILSISVNESTGQGNVSFKISTKYNDFNLESNAPELNVNAEKRNDLINLYDQQRDFFNRIHNVMEKAGLKDIVDINSNSGIMNIKFPLQNNVDPRKNPLDLFFGINSISSCTYQENCMAVSQDGIVHDLSKIIKFAVDEVNGSSSTDFIKAFNNKSPEERKNMFVNFMNFYERMAIIEKVIKPNIDNLKQTFNLFEKILAFFIKLFSSKYIKTKSDDFVKKLFDKGNCLNPLEQKNFDDLKNELKEENFFETTEKIVLEEIYQKCLKANYSRRF